MAESNSGPQRCPCGFWGTAQTMGLCSKCFKDQEKNLRGSAVDASSSDTKPGLKAADLTRAFDQASEGIANKASDATTSTESCSGNEKETSAHSSSDVQSMEATTVASEEAPSSTDNKTQPQTHPNGNKRDISDVQDPERPVQKNRKRCFKCNCKLELAIREIGICKCDYVFCQMHRLPEQHDCDFDHKEHGRKEARDKMVSPKKHVGTSLRRLDSDTY